MNPTSHSLHLSQSSSIHPQLCLILFSFLFLFPWLVSFSPFFLSFLFFSFSLASASRPWRAGLLFSQLLISFLSYFISSLFLCICFYFLHFYIIKHRRHGFPRYGAAGGPHNHLHTPVPDIMARDHVKSTITVPVLPWCRLCPDVQSTELAGQPVGRGIQLLLAGHLPQRLRGRPGLPAHNDTAHKRRLPVGSARRNSGLVCAERTIVHIRHDRLSGRLLGCQPNSNGDWCSGHCWASHADPVP